MLLSFRYEKKPLLNQHFYSSCLLRLSSSAVEKCLIILLECNNAGVQRQIGASALELMSFHTSTSSVSQVASHFTVHHLCWSWSVHLPFHHFNYLQSATTCEKTFKPNQTAVLIETHHIITFSYRMKTMSLCFHSLVFPLFHLCQWDWA